MANARRILLAVIASAFPNRHGKEDCSSYLAVTVTPATVLVTTVQTTTVSTTVQLTTTTYTTIRPTITQTGGTLTRGTTTQYRKRQVTVSAVAIPEYASACSGAVKYSSACSCLGVTRYTVTLPTPTSTGLATSISVAPTTAPAKTTLLTRTKPVVTTIGDISTVDATDGVVTLQKNCNEQGFPTQQGIGYQIGVNFDTNQTACIAE